MEGKKRTYDTFSKKLTTTTITFGDVAENHAGMEKIGKLHDRGYSLETLHKVQERLEAEGVKCELVPLHNHWEGNEAEVVEAYILVIRQGVQHILQTSDAKALMIESDGLAVDKHALMRGRVVNKIARWNLCFADRDQEPDYEIGKGRIVAFKHLPLLSTIRAKISELTDDQLLNGEANYYYDVSKCGIGYHGDGERKKVFAVRMGASLPIYYQWYHYTQPVGSRIEISLHDGDMYMMSEKAVGFDWLNKRIPTLRHATGCNKYTVIKPKSLS